MKVPVSQFITMQNLFAAGQIKIVRRRVTIGKIRLYVQSSPTVIRKTEMGGGHGARVNISIRIFNAVKVLYVGHYVR